MFKTVCRSTHDCCHTCHAMTMHGQCLQCACAVLRADPHCMLVVLAWSACAWQTCAHANSQKCAHARKAQTLHCTKSSANCLAASPCVHTTQSPVHTALHTLLMLMGCTKPCVAVQLVWRYMEESLVPDEASEDAERRAEEEAMLRGGSGDYCKACETCMMDIYSGTSGPARRVDPRCC